MRSALLAALVLSRTLGAFTANALTVNPAVGLADFSFAFDGNLAAPLGANVTWGGTPTLDLTIALPSSFIVHAEDCCVLGDEWALVVDGVQTAWDVVTGGDGFANGEARIGPGGSYYEALATIVLSAGSHTLDLHQTAGINGSSRFNMSPATVIPEPSTIGLVGLGLAAIVWRRRHRVAA